MSSVSSSLLVVSSVTDVSEVSVALRSFTLLTLFAGSLLGWSVLGFDALRLCTRLRITRWCKPQYKQTTYIWLYSA